MRMHTCTVYMYACACVAEQWQRQHVKGLGVHEVGGYLLLYTFILNTSSISY